MYVNYAKATKRGKLRAYVLQNLFVLQFSSKNIKISLKQIKLVKKDQNCVKEGDLSIIYMLL